MGSEEHPFTPEDVDEQIDHPSQALLPSSQSVPAAPEAQVIQGLHGLYSAETQEMTNALARGRERLAQSQEAWLATQQEDEHTSNHLRLSPARESARKLPLQRFLGAQRWPARLGGLAAAVLLVALVSSLVAGLVLVRHNATGAIGKGSTSTQPGATATSAPPAQTNLYLVSQMDASITKFDTTKRAIAWTYKWFTPPQGSSSYGTGFGPMLVGENSVYFAAGEAAGHDPILMSLYAVNTQTGTLRWNQKQPASAYPVLVEPGVVYVTAADGLYALNASDGSVRWHAPVAAGLGSLVLANGILYGTTFQTTNTGQWSSSLFAVNTADGTLLWQSPMPAGKSFDISAVVDGTLYLTSVEEKYQTTSNALIAMSDGKPKISYAYAYSLDGKQLWQSQKFDGYVGGLTIVDGIIYTVEFGNNVDITTYALNAKDGTMLWHYQADAGATLESGPIVANGTVYVESGPLGSDGTAPYVLIALNSQTGVVQWKQKLDIPAHQTASSCVLANGVLYLLIGTYPTSSLAAFSPDNGALLWQISLGNAFEPEIFAAL